ncbi:MAG TPA: ring-cleaving dioxygenase [Fimbriimonas sp.]
MSAHAIHHVTAVTAQIGQNLEYYTKVLGLRLVKRSVNQDDVSAYHLFYADGAGSPGTDMTFFDWPMIGGNVPGAGTIALTSFRAPSGSLDWWEARLADAESMPLREEGSILFADPEGQRLELVEDDLPTNAVAWTKSVPQEFALKGILGVDLDSLIPRRTYEVLTEILGFREEGNDLVVRDEARVGRVRLLEPSNRRGRVGAGGVHHVAFRVKDDEELNALQERIESAGLQTSGFVDRFYFHSLYFREPGGILFEMATDGPGFASDEDAESLGERLALPPFLEPQRKRIEEGLKPLPYVS